MATAEQRNHASAFLKKAAEYLASAEDNLAAGRNTFQTARIRSRPRRRQREVVGKDDGVVDRLVFRPVDEGHRWGRGSAGGRCGNGSPPRST